MAQPFWNTAIYAVVLLSSTVSFGQSQHTGYWRFSTPKGASVACKGAASNESMINTLEEVGWNDSQGYPNIDWTTDVVVIIAPDNYYKGYQIAFEGMFWDEIDLRYRIKYFYVPIVTEQRNGNSVTLGSTSASPETIVISYPKSIDDDPIYCSKTSP